MSFNSHHSAGSHENATCVLKAYLGEKGVPCFEREEIAKRHGKLATGSPCNLFVDRVGQAMLAIAVRGATLKAADAWHHTTYNYFSPKRLLRILQWEHAYSGLFEPQICYVIGSKPSDATDPSLFLYEGRQYRIVAVRPSEYQDRLSPRSPEGWGKIQVSSAAFKQMAVTLDSLFAISEN